MFRIRNLKNKSLHSINFIRKCSHQPSYSITEKNAEKIVSINLGNDKNIKLSTGKYARFANGTGVCEVGKTSMMVTAVSKDTPNNSSSNFMPLTVDFRQKYAAAGRIPTNFLRRELGVSEREILSSRLIDRSVRPLFPAHFNCETQLVCNMLALDSVYIPDVLSINAASFALAISDIPWNGPVGAVRLGLIDEKVIVNPSRFELQSSALDLVLTGTLDKLIVMIEGKANSIPIPFILKAINTGSKACHTICAAIDEFQKKYGKKKREVKIPTPIDSEIVDAIRSMCEMRLNEVFQNSSHDKMSRDQAIKGIRDDVVNRVWSSYSSVDPAIITDEFNKIVKSIFRELIFLNKRCDGRELDELRPISCEVNLHEPLHGSALFQRGQTQVMATVSLDSTDSSMKLDTLSSLNTGVKSKNFFLHYEFPPYATGEVGKVGTVGRREIGHGALAEKGLLPIVPNNSPFAMRLTAEVLESNGSSSMATVCAGTMALMDAGVPISSPAAGVAMGLVTKYNPENPTELTDYRILTDILGIEDYLGDMDMKVAATKEGLTAIQADIKTHGVPRLIITKAIEQSIKAKNKILHIMQNCISAPRSSRKECWPVTKELKIDPNQRSQLIGPGGMNLKKIFLETGVHLSETEPNTYNIFAPSPMSLNEAEEMIKEQLTSKNKPNFEFGGIYAAKIVEMKENGVMVKMYDEMNPTFIHVAQLDSRRVANPEALGFEVGHEIKVKYFGNDPVSGYMRLSRKMITTTSITC
ncbi:polyribonucleotide nucleotidyltransferase 1, mitochondrial [Contarinia nasturtii]|uniref:polyribonucleotide nucleotidyltransferase 1, mitochondrial n=1 Tax=Contarinia nasturtii TaxID=265458 RepID=UPI0012D44E73|nr:polyribonucleotide nucleotidyltransferase 1, mitochondrial [Contarinia nasturtii]